MLFCLKLYSFLNRSKMRDYLNYLRVCKTYQKYKYEFNDIAIQLSSLQNQGPAISKNKGIRLLISCLLSNSSPFYSNATKYATKDAIHMLLCMFEG